MQLKDEYGNVIERSHVSIPQAVSTVATKICGQFELFRKGVSIPQAVSTVATIPLNDTTKFGGGDVSIPQAVSTVATIKARKVGRDDFALFQYRKR